MSSSSATVLQAGKRPAPSLGHPTDFSYWLEPEEHGLLVNRMDYQEDNDEFEDELEELPAERTISLPKEEFPWFDSWLQRTKEEMGEN